MANRVHRDSISLWRALRETAGLEVEYRDADLVHRLKDALDPTAESLDAALASSSTDEFIQAFFQVIHPFVGIFRGILNFFCRANERIGKSQLRVSIEGEHIGLERFEEFLSRWNTVTVPTDVPAVDNDGVWALCRAVSLVSEENLAGRGSLPEPLQSGYSDIDEWFNRFDNGEYLPLPESIRQSRMGPGINDAIRIVQIVLSIIRKNWKNRDELHSRVHSEIIEPTHATAFTLPSIWQNETDHWLETNMRYLSRLLRMSSTYQNQVDTALQASFSELRRLRVDIQDCVRQLERLLSLPVWQKRHELYGVWVAAELVNALESDGHAVSIQHDDGELEFAFREARIAEIMTTEPMVSIVTEHRTELAHPIGIGRVHGVQPDFGLWRGDFVKCELVVEVKHYRKRSRRNFRDVLIDYGRAHPLASIVLVNYGPTGTPFDDLPSDVNSRSRMIGNLTPDNESSRQEFRKIIRSAIGKPDTRGTEKWISASELEYAIDCSLMFRPGVSEMLETLITPGSVKYFQGFFTMFPISNSLIQLEYDHPFFCFLRSCTSIDDLLCLHDLIILFTDSFGFKELESQTHCTQLMGELASGQIKVLKVQRTTAS